MDTEQHRVFFALWPNDVVRDDIRQAVTPSIKDNPARKVPRHNWHITLAFVGNVSDETLECLKQQADKVSFSPFKLTLDHFDYWPRPRVAWLGCESMPEEMIYLEQDLQTRLKNCGYHSDFKIYTPHITLLRNAKKPINQQPKSKVSWDVDKFVLVESKVDHTGSSYEIINQWAPA